MKKCIVAAIKDSFWISLAFYLLSNFLVFAFCDLYAKSFMGLIWCYVCALPFFVNKLSLLVFFLSLLVHSVTSYQQNECSKN